MKSLLCCIGIFFIALGIQGCAAPYYGLTGEEWNSLSEDEQAAVKAEYRDILALQEGQKRRKLHDARTQSIVDYGINGRKSGQ